MAEPLPRPRRPWRRWIWPSLAVAAVLGSGLDGLTRSPRWQAFGQVLSHGDGRERLVALSFDDGPNPRTTPRILEALQRTGTRASFFLVGHHIREYPDLARSIVAAGQEVGNHSYSHDPMVLERPWRYRWEIARTDQLIRDLGYRGVIRFRPPYGRKLLVLPWILAREGRLDVLWDVNPEDWTVRDPRVITSRVLAQVRPGSVVLLHEHPATAQALEPMIRGLRQRGYRLVSLEELIHGQAPAPLMPDHRLPEAVAPSPGRGSLAAG